MSMRLSAGGGSHPPLPDPSVDHARALRLAIGRGHVTKPQMERREARVSPVARRCAPVSSRDDAGNEDVVPHGAPSPLIYEEG